MFRLLIATTIDSFGLAAMAGKGTRAVFPISVESMTSDKTDKIIATKTQDVRA